MGKERVGEGKAGEWGAQPNCSPAGTGLALTEAEEEGVHAHPIDTEEPVGNEVGAHDHRLQEGLGGVTSFPGIHQGGILLDPAFPRERGLGNRSSRIRDNAMGAFPGGLG